MNRRRTRTAMLSSRIILGLAGTLLLSQVGVALAQSEADMDPTEVLRKEHTIIRRMAKAAERTAQRVRKGREVDVDRVAKFHDFFTNFADKCHHAKEEDELFPVLREMNVDDTVVALLVKQHEEGRILLAGVERQLQTLRNDGTKQDRQALARYLTEYADLMGRHIDLENEYLWPKTAEQLDQAQKDKLAKAFHRIESVELGEGFHEKYHAMAMELLGKKKH